MLEILGYIVILGLSIWGAIAALTTIISVPFGFLRLGMTFSQIFAGAVIWLGLFYLWRIIYHEPMPLFLIVLAGISLYHIYPKYFGAVLNNHSRNLIQIQSIGFIIISIYFLIKLKEINWY